MKTKNKKYIIHYTNGDLFVGIKNRLNMNNNSPVTIIVPHVCNNVGSFGAGFAKAVAQNYPIVQENFYLLGKQAQLGYVQFIDVETKKSHDNKIVFANMIAQNGTICSKNPRPLNYVALMKSMLNVRNFALSISINNDTNVEIHAPKFGCGLAGGNWNFIKDLMHDIWNEIDTFVYQL